MPEHWETVLANMAKMSKDTKKEFLRTVEETKTNTDWDSFEKELDSGNLAAAIDEIDWVNFDPQILVELGLSTSASAAADYINFVAKINYKYDPTMKPALDWAKQYAAQEVKLINEPTKQAIRDAIQSDFAKSINPKSTAKFIKSQIGLLPNQTKAVSNYAEALRKKGLSEDDILKKTAKYSEKQLTRRAETIAVNEASEIASWGHFYATKDAVLKGDFDPREWEEIRIVTPDEMLCKKCRPLEGEARQIPDGVYVSTGSQIAKVHIKCRCVAGLQRKTKGDSMMQFDSVQIGGKIVYKDDKITVVSGRLMEEGVQNGGLKRWESFYDPEGLQGCMWFEGVPIVKYAHPPGRVDSSMELAGRVRAIKPDPVARAVFAEFVLFNSMYSDDEMKLIESGEFIGGSIGYDFGGIKYFDEPQVWQPTGETYDFECLPPFYGDHFAIFVNPACAACGLNADSKHDGCKCSRKKEELMMTVEPPAQAGTKGAPAQAGTQGDDGKGEPAPVVQQQKTQGDQMNPEALKIKAQAILGIQDEYVRAKEAMALLLEFVTGEAPTTAPPGMGDSLMTKLEALEKKIGALAADNKRLTDAEKARVQADAAAKDAADSAALKANFDQAYQMDWDKHWPKVKAEGINAFLADSENAKHWVGPQASQKIDPTGQRFVQHPGADSEKTEFDAGIDAELKKVR